MKRVKLAPKLVIFDVDGVLVDVHGSFHRSIIDTVQHFTGRRVPMPTFSSGSRSPATTTIGGYSTDWVNSLGDESGIRRGEARSSRKSIGDDEVAQRGNVWRERWLVSPRRLERWAKRAELALFTGRTRRN